MSTITIRDESMAGSETGRFTLDFPTETITIRELIRERVYQEVQDYNRRKDGVFRGLVQPTDAEAALNSFNVKPGREIDWHAQFDKACEAFQKNRVLILVADRQAASLEETVQLTRGVEVTFLRLVLLVGG